MYSMFAIKPELGLQMIRRAQAQELPFDSVACDEVYGRSREFRATLDAEGIPYAYAPFSSPSA